MCERNWAQVRGRAKPKNMGVKLEAEPEYLYRDRYVSALGLRLRKLREQIEAAAARGETKLLNKDELQRELDDLRPSDPDLS
jgi:hypothetical protein